MEAFGHAKKELLRRYLDLSRGVPSHETVTRVFRVLDSAAFRRCFIAWPRALAALPEGEV
jgi:hypothetical protein